MTEIFIWKEYRWRGMLLRNGKPSLRTNAYDTKKELVQSFRRNYPDTIVNDVICEARIKQLNDLWDS
jgi:hypothetical protein